MKPTVIQKRTPEGVLEEHRIYSPDELEDYEREYIITRQIERSVVTLLADRAEQLSKTTGHGKTLSPEKIYRYDIPAGWNMQDA